MPESRKMTARLRLLKRKFNTTTVSWLGVSGAQKEALYLDLSRAATLRDAVYWLQILFAAGIATLGLVLNSPAVIIGAMLISPLMGPIFASGLAFATGDLVLGLRAVFKLFLSCALAIGFAVVLVVVLPFREMTPEIAARTQPNVLDLLIALFSGAVGSIATCREVKGVVTSIPGVAIAVALMPPLCVVGYGLGLIAVFDQATGARVASGGGLLFLTNLVAITLTAMLVFLAVRLNTPRVAASAEEWEHHDAESTYIVNFIERFPRLAQAREIRSLLIRFVMILAPLALILVPLGQSFNQLQREIVQKRRENVVRQEILEVWKQRFQNKSDGVARSSIDQLTILEKDDKLNIQMRVFDDQPYTAAERKECVKLIAAELNRPVESVSLQLVEIPTTSVLAAMQAREKPVAALPPLTIAQLHSNLREQVETAMSGFSLPAPAQLVNYRITTDAAAPLHVKLIYLSGDNLQPEAQTTLVEQIKAKLNYDEATVSLERIPTNGGAIRFARNQAAMTFAGMLELDFAGRVLRENPELNLNLAGFAGRGERPEIIGQRTNAVAAYLESRWQIPADKIKIVSPVSENGGTTFNFEIANNNQEIQTASESKAVATK